MAKVAKVAKASTNVENLLESIPKLLEQRKFRSVLPSGKNKAFGHYQITGAFTKWKTKKETDFVYSYETRLAGSKKDVVAFLKNFTDENVEILQDLLGEDRGDHISSKKDLINQIITFGNHNDPSDNPSNPSNLFEYEKEQKKNKKVKKEKEPTIDQYYDAFLKYKQRQKKIEDGKLQTDQNPKILRMKNIGDLYQKLGPTDILNVFGYSNVGGVAVVVKVDQVDQNNGKKLHKVPNYKILASKKKDIEYVLKDLITVGTIGLKKTQINEVIEAWAENKKSGSKGEAGEVEEGPREIKTTSNSNRKAPMVTKTKIKVTKA